MRMDNVEEMPFHHTHYISNENEVKLILDYNKHDVRATNMFFNITKGDTDLKLYKGKDKLSLRKDVLKKYKINCLNYPDVKIGEELLLKLYCDETGNNPYYVKKWRTPREKIILNDLILPSIKFKTSKFKNLLQWFKSQTIYGTKGVFNDISLNKVSELLPYVHPSSINKRKGTLSNVNLELQGNQIDYGVGGLHHSSAGLFTNEDEEYIIYDIDVGSMYPSIAVQNNFYPEHLGEVFTKVYDKNIVAVRLKEKEKPKKERNFVIMEGFKLSANGAYGKSNEESSFLYDPQYTLSITVNGQLLLSMLVEALLIGIEGVIFIQINTKLFGVVKFG